MDYVRRRKKRKKEKQKKIWRKYKIFVGKYIVLLDFQKFLLRCIRTKILYAFTQPICYTRLILERSLTGLS